MLSSTAAHEFTTQLGQRGEMTSRGKRLCEVLSKIQP